MATFTISVSDEVYEWIDAEVAAGDYASASDYLYDLIRRDQRQREAVKRALIEGEQSGVSTRNVSDIIATANSVFKDR